MTTLEPPLVLCPGYSAAYNARLERLGTGVYSERDKRDEAYNRSKRVERAKAERDRKRVYRGYDRANRENDARKKLRTARFVRREAILWKLFEPIRDRVMAENKIRMPGKAPKSVHAWRDKLNAALATDPEYQAFRARQERFDRLIERIKSGRPNVVAGILAVDDRATRHAKVRAWRESQAAAARGRGAGGEGRAS